MVNKLEKITIAYDDKYLGEGYFIIYDNGEEYKFVKFYMSGNFGFPVFHVRAYERGAKDLWNQEFRNVEIGVGENNSELQGYLKKLRYYLMFHNQESIKTIDPVNQGLNHIKVINSDNKEKLIVSKSIYKGRFATPDFIDVILGDNYSCEMYEGVLEFYYGLSKISDYKMSESDISKLILK